MKLRFIPPSSCKNRDPAAYERKDIAGIGEKTGDTIRTMFLIVWMSEAEMISFTHPTRTTESAFATR
ncbi:MAG: hypothetical protein R2682_13620 [Pyrinomonadaceae bacterium]